MSLKYYNVLNIKCSKNRTLKFLYWNLKCSKSRTLFCVLKTENQSSEIITKKFYFSNIYRKVLILEH